METVADQGIFTRGVLFDATLLPQLREGNNPWLAPGTRVTRADLEALERQQGVWVGPGDVVLLYTGRWKRRAALGPWTSFCTGAARPPTCGYAGYWYDNIPFFYERDIAQFGSDAWNDVTPTDGLDAYATLPYHGFQAAMGIAHYDNLDLEALASVAKQLRRWEFVFATAPFPVVGALTSPLNPIAVF
jgi:kynurenine formamidase